MKHSERLYESLQKEGSEKKSELRSSIQLQTKHIRICMPAVFSDIAISRQYGDFKMVKSLFFRKPE